MSLGRLEKIDLRTYWKKEATDFTPWLAKEENIQLLSDTIGIELEVQSQEQSVGPFSADILCKDTINDHYVLIENQLERTDHTHLGQLMTYAAGLDAVTIIWIAQKFTEEHRAALDWLNRITDETFNFFGIEIELFKIGESKPAPLFKLISKPNDWSKQVKKSTGATKFSENQLAQQEYWRELKTYMDANSRVIKMQKPQPVHWANLAIGRSNFSLSANVSSRDNTISVWLNITGERAKEHYDILHTSYFEKSKIEISPEIIWARLDNKKMSGVGIKLNANFNNNEDRNRQFIWFRENLEKFTKFFKPIILKL
jgi:hypothetical protein